MPRTTHANARLAPAGRLALARCAVDDGWPLRRAVERFQTRPTTKRWADRYRTLGPAGMIDASSRPARSHQRVQSPEPTSRTSRVRGPCTPSTRSSSMSLVAEGPLIQVSGSDGSNSRTACGTPSTTWSARTTHRW